MRNPEEESSESPYFKYATAKIPHCPKVMKMVVKTQMIPDPALEADTLIPVVPASPCKDFIRPVNGRWHNASCNTRK